MFTGGRCNERELCGRHLSGKTKISHENKINLTVTQILYAKTTVTLINESSINIEFIQSKLVFAC